MPAVQAQVSDRAPTDGEFTRAIKAALRKEFPAAKFAVTLSIPRVQWTDDGPTVEAVQTALVHAGVVTYDTTTYGRPVFLVHNHYLYFDRYNVAERAAQKADQERRAQEYEAQRKREQEAISAAYNAKRATLQRPSSVRQAASPLSDHSAQTAFEEYRERVERDVSTGDAERQRRPSHAPPLILEGELLDICIKLDLLKPDDQPLARFWAGFAAPNKRGTVLREQRSTLTLSGIACRTLQLFAGTERGTTSDILFEAQRKSDGSWRFGPRLSPTITSRALMNGNN